jgi:membrane fusion protein, multidrug efflux system
MICRFAGAVLMLAISAAGHAQSIATHSSAAGGDHRIRTQLSARDAVVLSSELAARIATLPLREGESFKHGDTLVAFDCSLNEAQLKKARAAAESARQLVLVNKRMAELNSIGALELQHSENKVKEAEADVHYMQASVRKCIIAAPFNGRIAKRLVANHQYVNMGTPLLDILGSDQLELQMIVPSRWLAWLRPGAGFSVAIDELGKNYDAKVTQIGARIDAVSQTIAITGKITDRSPELLAGMSGWASFPPP